MHSIRAEKGQVKYGIYDFILDTEAELKNFKILKNKILPGSTIFIVENSTKYILNNQYQWKQIKTCSTSNKNESSNNDSDEDNEIIYDGGDLSGSDDENHIIYDGGDVIGW